MNSRSFILALTLTGLSSIASPALANPKVVCEGPVHVFGSTKGGKLKELNRSAPGFEFSQEDVLFLRIGLDPMKPIADVMPWGKITSKAYPKHPDSKVMQFHFQTDGANWFTISLVGKTSRVVQTLQCEVKYESGDNRDPQSLKKGAAKKAAASKKSKTIKKSTSSTPKSKSAGQ